MKILGICGSLQAQSKNLTLSASDAVLIASPEYGFSLPGALKNAIDWVIGSGELEGKWWRLRPQSPARSAAGEGCKRSTTR